MNPQDVDKLRGYINGSLKDYVEKKENKKFDPISITFDSQTSQLLLDGGEYLQILKSKYINIINDVIIKIYQVKSRNINIRTSSPLLLKLEEVPIPVSSTLLNIPIQSITVKSKRGRPKKQQQITSNLNLSGSTELYFGLLPEDLLLEILKQSLGYTYYDKFMENTKDIFGKLLEDKGINQLLFYYLVPYYEHVKTLPSEVNSWEHLFEITYRNEFPPKEEDTKMIVRGKEIIRPIENAFSENPYVNRSFQRIKNVKNDNKGLPVSFNTEFYDTHNQVRDTLYFINNNNIESEYTDYERRVTKWYYMGYGADSNVKNELFEISGSFNIISNRRDTLLYYHNYPKLIIPWKGIDFTYAPVIRKYYLFKVINIEWGNEIPIKLDAIYIGEKNSSTDENEDLSIRKLTIIPREDKEGYTSVEIPTLQDQRFSSFNYLLWNNKE